uniref:Uncharacterized protein n=1 Tax=Oryza glumipatula TaxID=40148 RepID=A0A0D9YR77_9ORYZ
MHAAWNPVDRSGDGDESADEGRLFSNTPPSSLQNSHQPNPGAEAPDLVIATATTKQERASSRGDPRSSDCRCKALDPDERLAGSRSGRETDRKYTTVAESNPCRCRGHSTPSTARAALWPRCMTRCRHEVKMGSQQGEKELGDGGLGDQQAWHGRTRRCARGGRWWEGIRGNIST